MTDDDADPSSPVRPAPEAPQPRAATAPPDYVSLSLYKIMLIGGLAIATILPNLFITNLIEERETRQDGVRQEFTRNWGPEQNLYSPTLVIPYQAGDRPRQYIKIAPARLDLAAALNPQERKRGLFHATVYDAKVEMSGAFVVPAEARLRDFVADKDGRFIWNEACDRIRRRRRTSPACARPTTSWSTAPSSNGCRVSKPCAQEAACRGATLVLANAPLAPPR